jgi:hypothetical protein
MGMAYVRLAREKPRNFPDTVKNLYHMHVMLNRRRFLGTAAASLACVNAQSTSEWGRPVLDIRLHPHRQEGGELDHVNGSGVTKAVLLTGSAMAEHSRAVVARYPGALSGF